MAVEELPDEVLLYLMASRYCETDRLVDFAWSQFGNTSPGWERVQAINTWVHNHVRFDYQRAGPPSRLTMFSRSEKVFAGILRIWR
jgi:transglutaminase-like putative cysteine protease